MRVSDLFIYPLKSARGIAIPSATIDAFGLIGDRRAMLVEPSGHFITQRELQDLARIDIQPGPSYLRLKMEGKADIIVPPPHPDNRMDVDVWKAVVNASVADDETNKALSVWFGREVKLVFFDSFAKRIANPEWASGETPVTFSDGYQILVTTTGSLKALNADLAAHGEGSVGMERFRPNIVIDCDEEWPEDRWAAIEIGGYPPRSGQALRPLHHDDAGPENRIARRAEPDAGHGARPHVRGPPCPWSALRLECRAARRRLGEDRRYDDGDRRTAGGLGIQAAIVALPPMFGTCGPGAAGSCLAPVLKPAGCGWNSRNTWAFARCVRWSAPAAVSIFRAVLLSVRDAAQGNPSPALPAAIPVSLILPSAPDAAPRFPTKPNSATKPNIEAIPAKSEGDADRRPVTVLFADLCGFTTLSEQIDPEVMRVLQNELFEEMTQAVEAYGGFVDKFVGDALLALFGAPVAHEDDPVRALSAALDMIDRATQVGERWRRRAGVPLRLHIGINSGPVVTGGFGAVNTKSYSVTGDTVNTAQRLQSMAGENDILVGPLTYRLTRHAFAFDSLGAQTLRGKSGNVLVHRLTGPLEAPHTARGLESFGLQAPMIGRDTELSRLLTCLDLACGGAAQLVRLIGEAGIGKSRLVNEFIGIAGNAARFQGLAIRKATCSPLGEQSYGTLAAVVRSAYGIGERDNLDRTRQLLTTGFRALDLTQEDVDGLLPLFLHVLGLGDPDGALRHIEPEQLRRQIFYAVRTVFERRLAQGPLLLVIEDLHWADAASLEVLRFMMDRLERSRLMLLAIYRPTSQIDPLDSNRVSVTVQRLGPLIAADGQKLLAAFFGEVHGKLPVTMRKRILDRAGGNPLFIEEILRGLIDMGTLHNDGQRWHVAAEDTDVDIPVNLQALLLARVDRLPQEIRRLAQEAAVVGPKFDTALLRSVATDPAAIDAALDYLCDANIIEELRGPDAGVSPTYRFSQPCCTTSSIIISCCNGAWSFIAGSARFWNANTVRRPTGPSIWRSSAITSA